MGNERVRFFPPKDICYGMGLNKIEIIDVPSFDDIDINDAIEYYQIILYFNDGVHLKSWSSEQYHEFEQKARKLNGLSMRFFNSLCDETIIQNYEKLETEYCHAFWELFNNCKLYKRISPLIFSKLIYSERVSPSDLFKYRDIVINYGVILKDFLLDKNLRLYKLEHFSHKNCFACV